MKISVIVPVYNAEKYLRRCVDSILAQTFTDFELILVDDGSKDASASLCDEYAATSEGRIRSFHKPNGGASSARNLGLQQAQGEYIVFVDADDWVDDTYLEEILPASPSEWNICAITFEGSQSFPSGNPLRRYVHDIAHFLKDNLTNQAFSGPVCKAYRRETLLKENIRFREDFMSNEDLMFALDYLATGLVTDIRVLPACSYHYDRTCEGSLTSRLLPLEQSYKQMDAIDDKISRINAVYDCNCGYVHMLNIASCFVNICRQIKSPNVPRWQKPGAFLHTLRNRHVRRLLQDRDFLIHRSELSLSKRIAHEAAYGALKVFYFLVR